MRIIGIDPGLSGGIAILDDLKVIVESTLETTLGIGDKCTIKFIIGEEYLILPEKIRSKF